MRPTARYEAKSENASLSPHLSAPPTLHMIPHICEGMFQWLIVVSLLTSLYLPPLCLHFSSSWRLMRYDSVLRVKRHPELNGPLTLRGPFCFRVASDEMKGAALEVLGRDRVMVLALVPYYSSRMSIGVPQALPNVTVLELGSGSARNNTIGAGDDAFRNDEQEGVVQ